MASSPLAHKATSAITWRRQGQNTALKAAKLRARVCLGGFVVDFGGNVHYLSHGPLCGCERSGATREETSAVNLTGLVRSVMQMETRG